MPKLGVNIDHVATVRQARKAVVPDPVAAARLCEKAGCDSIVCHLREDRRHINDADVKALRRSVRTRLNLEMAIAPEIISIACRIRPDQATLVPERRQEVTTEGGLDVVRNRCAVRKAVSRLQKSRINVSLFINPDRKQIAISPVVGATIIELHTGAYANAGSVSARARELKKLRDAAAYALSLGLEVNAGHGLDYRNALSVARIAGMHELNIGHSIISASIFVGIEEAVRRMKELCR